MTECAKCGGSKEMFLIRDPDTNIEEIVRFTQLQYKKGFIVQSMIPCSRCEEQKE